jgi:nicotinate-nucleotide--dimethylbenzimidazole phosphoribosyltransferase
LPPADGSLSQPGLPGGGRTRVCATLCALIVFCFSISATASARSAEPEPASSLDTKAQQSVVKPIASAFDPSVPPEDNEASAAQAPAEPGSAAPDDADDPGPAPTAVAGSDTPDTEDEAPVFPRATEGTPSADTATTTTAGVDHLAPVDPASSTEAPAGPVPPGLAPRDPAVSAQTPMPAREFETPVAPAKPSGPERPATAKRKTDAARSPRKFAGVEPLARLGPPRSSDSSPPHLPPSVTIRRARSARKAPARAQQEPPRSPPRRGSTPPRPRRAPSSSLCGPSGPCGAGLSPSALTLFLTCACLMLLFERLVVVSSSRGSEGFATLHERPG